MFATKVSCENVNKIKDVVFLLFRQCSNNKKIIKCILQAFIRCIFVVEISKYTLTNGKKAQ